MTNEQKAEIDQRPLQMEMADVEQVRGEGYMSTYANSVNLMVSPWDIRLIFGELMDTGDKRGARIENRASVVMSPQHAKAFSIILARHLEKYEAEHGAITLKPETEEKLKA